MSYWKVIICTVALALGGSGFAGVAMANGHAVQASLVGRQAADEKKQPVRPVLLVSIDGLSPDSLFQAEQLGLKIPTLRRLLAEGASASRVINVNPTVTNPNHTSMVTGASPRRHGVFNNRPFVPAAKLPAGYREYSDIRLPTLWSVAKAAGLGTASLYWPVTRGAAPIDSNILDGSSHDDDQITCDAIAIMQRDRPELMTVHYVSHDAAQHQYGPGTAEARASLERIDAALGRLLAEQMKLYRDPVIAIASDHGFYPVRNRVHLNTAFVEEGLIQLDEAGPNGLQDWRAFAWYVGGMAMVVLKDPADQALRHEVEGFLRRLAARPDGGIERILSTAELKGSGLSDQAQYVIALKSGYHMGSDMTGDYLRPFVGGAHGAYTAPDVRPEMHSAFIIAGQGIAAGQDLGIIDIRQIAPTLARFLKVQLPDAEKAALAFKSRP